MTVHTHHHFDHDVEARAVDWRAWAKAILLIGLGLDLAFLIVTNTITFYISPHFAWLTNLASGLLLFFGVLTVIDLVRGTGHHHHHEHDHDENCDHDHDEHQHEEITWAILAVIAVPLVLGLLFPAQPLSAESVNGGISTSSVGVSNIDIAALPATERDIIQWLRLFESNEDLSAFEGEAVDVIGFIYDEPGFGEQHTMVVRFAISCCVADALAIGLPINVADIAVPEQGVWVRVTGALQIGDFNGNEMPIIIPQHIEPIAMPADPYLYT